ncbi:SirA-like protein [candidate division WOR-1 bacterium DG_54_3]|jgi:tRNA 2-thiouridine synthesizing protein A|uniref:SirA-like protein n=1 Tax=candidate division WOR-1 bacterium DG_54_3 TaxID=1703775 RepID=A0A0S7Y4K9_UNCSA|nr:MAG: SirA-like protein [candidate division WOR-1 bacterium DG_54_3]
MATKTLDTLGLKCPQPILKVATLVPQMNPGDILEVLADCESFPKDIKAWAEKTGKTLLFCNTDADGKHTAQIQF